MAIELLEHLQFHIRLKIVFDPSTLSMSKNNQYW